MKRSLRACLIPLCASAVWMGCSPAMAAESNTFVTVNGQAQPMAWAEAVYQEQRQRGVPEGDGLRQAVREGLVLSALMEEEARKSGLDKNALIQAQMALAQREVLVRAWQLNELRASAPSEADILKEYKRQVARLGETEYRLRHLLLQDETAAKLLLEKINAGTKLESLAATYSQDARTKDKGGLTDWAPLGDLLPPLAEAVKGMKPGKQVPQPVQTNLGWHVLQVEETRPFKAPSLEDVRPQVLQLIAKQALEARIKGMREKARVE